MKMVDTKKSALASDGVRVNRTGRRTYTSAYKLDVVRRCSEPGVSVAAVAMAHGINVNLVRRWIVRHQRASLSTTPTFEAALLPVTIEASASGARNSDDKGKPPARRNHPAAGSIEIELHGARIHLRGSVDVCALTAVIDVLARR